MLYAGIIYYNDTPDFLLQSILALKKCGFAVIAIDGAYREFFGCQPPGEFKDFFSTDGCRDIADKYADLSIPAPPWGWFDQAQKRSAYFKVVPEGSYVFVVDADEIMVECVIDESKLTDDVYRIMLQPENFSTVRVYKTYPDLQYLYQHCRIYRTFGHDPTNKTTATVTEAHSALNASRKFVLDTDGTYITIRHLKNLRSQERQDWKNRFREIRKEKEYAQQMALEK